MVIEPAEVPTTSGTVVPVRMRRLASMVSAFFVAMMAILMGLLYLAAFVPRRNQYQYAALTVFYLAVGVWILSINPVFQFMVDSPLLRNKIEYISMYLVMAFAEAAIASRWHRITRVLWVTYGLFAVLALLLDALGLFPLWRTLAPFWLIMAFGNDAYE